jgi:hypothetical protein
VIFHIKFTKKVNKPVKTTKDGFTNTIIKFMSRVDHITILNPNTLGCTAFIVFCALKIECIGAVAPTRSVLFKAAKR